MSDQKSDPLKGDPNVAPRGGKPLPLPPLVRDPAVTRNPHAKE